MGFWKYHTHRIRNCSTLLMKGNGSKGTRSMAFHAHLYSGTPIIGAWPRSRRTPAKKGWLQQTRTRWRRPRAYNSTTAAAPGPPVPTATQGPTFTTAPPSGAQAPGQGGVRRACALPLGSASPARSPRDLCLAQDGGCSQAWPGPRLGLHSSAPP